MNKHFLIQKCYILRRVRSYLYSVEFLWGSPTDNSIFYMSLQDQTSQGEIKELLNTYD